MESYLKKIFFLIFLENDCFISLKHFNFEVLTETYLILNIFLEYLPEGSLYSIIFEKKIKFNNNEKIKIILNLLRAL